MFVAPPLSTSILENCSEVGENNQLLRSLGQIPQL
jgi:hypothetical protein